MSRREARVAGMMGAGVALAVLWVASAIDPNIPFPPAALADRIVRATPGDVATFFIEVLHQWALRFLTLGVVVAAIVLGGEAFARIMREGRPQPAFTGSLLAVLAAVAALTSPGGSPSIVGVLLVVAVAGAIYARVASATYGNLSDAGAPDESRRRALKVGVVGALGLAAVGGAAGWVARRFSGPNRDVELVSPAAPASKPPRPDFPDIAGLSPEITSVEDHYEVDIDLLPPTVEVEGWAIALTGLVDNPLNLTFDGLQRTYEVVEDYSVLSCVSNEVGGDLVGNSAWGGVRLKEVLEDAGVRPGAVDVVLRAADGYSDSIPIDVARDPSVILAVSHNGEPLTQGHGFPCRLRVPRIYGMKNVKWIESIEIVGTDYDGYWQKRGWSDDATVRTQSRIDVAGDDLSAVAGSETWIAGVAWAGQRGIENVEVSVDGGESWERAKLKPPVAEDAWTQWAFAWRPARRGRVMVQCRATDGDGTTQTTDEAAPHPAGATGLHMVEVEVG